MNIIKKATAVVSAAVLLLGMAACGSSNGTTSLNSTPKEPVKISDEEINKKYGCEDYHDITKTIYDVNEDLSESMCIVHLKNDSKVAIPAVRKGGLFYGDIQVSLNNGELTVDASKVLADGTKNVFGNNTDIFEIVGNPVVNVTPYESGAPDWMQNARDYKYTMEPAPDDNDGLKHWVKAGEKTSGTLSTKSGEYTVSGHVIGISDGNLNPVYIVID